MVALATAVTLATPCRAMQDSVCDKWEFADDGGVELKKCRAAEGAAQQYIDGWLAKHGAQHSPSELELGDRHVYERCAMLGAGPVYDLAQTAECLKGNEARELKNAQALQGVAKGCSEANAALTEVALHGIPDAKLIESLCTALKAQNALPSGSAERLECARTVQTLTREAVKRDLPVAGAC
jgi:hypothetical protein